ncbi:hypothetical protein [Leptospira meyeri]|uniref:hypothetical protein n=1 Tax=Leptospira meyeri TaxID=29508 RepID=UPI0002D631F3|nr:hypothetical protein [Leptospira meyeri]
MNFISNLSMDVLIFLLHHFSFLFSCIVFRNLHPELKTFKSPLIETTDGFGQGLMEKK